MIKDILVSLDNLILTYDMEHKVFRFCQKLDSNNVKILATNEVIDLQDASNPRSNLLLFLVLQANKQGDNKAYYSIKKIFGEVPEDTIYHITCKNYTVPQFFIHQKSRIKSILELMPRLNQFEKYEHSALMEIEKALSQDLAELHNKVGGSFKQITKIQDRTL